MSENKMYFKNISNEELRQFHPVQTHDFIMSLTEVLDSNLFKIENHDGIYRIFPLFYCNTIKSNNPLDNILENRCIIASKMSEETYFTFSTDGSDDLPVIPSSFLNDTFKGLDSDLTTGEYNKLVYLLRANYPFNDTIRLNKLVTGEYGTYHFRSVTDDMGTILDNGILLSDSLKQNGLQVMLSDPVFHYSRYLLHLKIYDFGDGDIPFDGDLTNASVTDLSVELVNGEYVDIQLTGEYRYAVISLDATVEIIHDKPILPDTVMSIDLTANPTIIQTGEHSEMYAKVRDEYGSLAQNVQVHFYQQTEAPVPTTLSVVADNHVLSYSDGDKAVLTATVRDQDSLPMSNQSVVFKVGDTVLDTVLTDGAGVAEYEYISQGVGDVTFTVECMNVSKTYELEDIDFYDAMTSASGHWSIPSQVSGSSIFGYNSDGWKFGQTTSGYQRVELDYAPTLPYQIEVDVTEVGSAVSSALFVNDGYNRYIQWYYNENKIYVQGNSQSTVNHTLTSKFIIKVYSDRIELHDANGLLKSQSMSQITPKIAIDTGNQSGRWLRIKDFKIKQL